MSTFSSSIIAGVISGIVASFLYAFIKQICRPRIKIVPVMIYLPERKLVGVKLINRSHWRISDLECSLDYFQRDHANGGYTLKNLPRTQEFNPILEKHVNDANQANPDALYAIKIGFKADFNVTAAPFGDKFVLSVQATHPLSGTKVSLSKEFFCSSLDIKKDCDFNNGDTYSVHQINYTKPESN